MEYLGTPPEVKDQLAAILEGSEDRYSKLQLYFLRRLNYLLRLRQQRGREMDSASLRLLDRAIFSTYRDCAATGVTADAQKVIQTVASPSSTERTRKN
jgi:hypothetical protein